MTKLPMNTGYYGIAWRPALTQDEPVDAIMAGKRLRIDQRINDVAHKPG